MISNEQLFELRQGPCDVAATTPERKEKGKQYEPINSRSYRMSSSLNRVE